MKKITATRILMLTCILSIIFGVNQLGYAKQNGAPSGNTGSPGDGQSCAHTSCHTGSASTRDGLISTNVPATGYLSGVTYLVTVSIDEPGITEFGFQAAPQNLSGDLMGDMELISATDTKFTGAGKYITHTSVGTAGTDSRTWTFNWTPSDAAGDVTFYVAVNASNDMDNASGDKIYTSSVKLIEDPNNHPVAVHEANPVRLDITAIVSNNLVLTVSSPLNEPISIDLFDINGRHIVNQQHGFANGQFEIPVATFTSGIYFARISNSSSQLTKQFIIQ